MFLTVACGFGLGHIVTRSPDPGGEGVSEASSSRRAPDERPNRRARRRRIPHVRTIARLCPGAYRFVYSRIVAKQSRISALIARLSAMASRV